MIVFIHFIFLLTIIDNKSNAFYSSDLFLKSNLTRCQNSISHKFDCRNKFCAKEKKVCDEYSVFNKLLLTVKNEFKNHFKSIIQKVKPCAQNKWKSNDVCLNKNSVCFKDKSNTCKCDHKYSFKCKDPYYCAIKSEACDGINFINKKSIKNCGN